MITISKENTYHNELCDHFKYHRSIDNINNKQSDKEIFDALMSKIDTIIFFSDVCHYEYSKYFKNDKFKISRDNIKEILPEDEIFDSIDEIFTSNDFNYVEFFKFDKFSILENFNKRFNNCIIYTTLSKKDDIQELFNRIYK